jgi:hypothetical protein
MFSGLPQGVRELRAELRGDIGLRGPAAPADQRGTSRGR